MLGIFKLPDAGVHSFAEFKNKLTPEALTMLRSPDSPSGGGIPWYAVLLGYPVLGVWYWCSDQTIVQRTLGARSERDARLGPIFTAILKLLPVFFMLTPGAIAYVLFKDKIMEYLYENSNITETHLKLKRNRLEWIVNNEPMKFIDFIDVLYARDDFKPLYRQIETFLYALTQ